MGSSVVEFIIVSDYDNDGSERGQSPAPSDDVSSRESSAEPEPVPTNGRSERPPTSTPVEGSRKPRSSEEALRHSGRLADPGYKSFACSICSESFNFKFELLRHKMSHYEKPKKTRLPSVNDRWRIKFKKHRVQKKRKPGKRASSARKKSLDDPMFLTPLELGWTRLAVHRSSDPKKCDIYYKNPDGRKFRSVNELSTVKLTNGLSLDHFTFRRCPLNLLHPREIVCNARPQAATSSPQAPKTKISPPPQVPAKTATPQNGMIRETPQTSVQKSPTKKEITPKTKTTPTPKAPSKFYPKASSSQSDDGTDQKFLLPLNNGWTRLVVGRPKNKGYDVCYMNSEGQKFRSLSDMRRQKFKKGIALENFTFKRCPLDLKHPNEILKTSGSSSVKKELPKAKNSPGPHKVPTKKEVASVRRPLKDTPRSPFKAKSSPIDTRKKDTSKPKMYKITKTLSIVKKAETSNAKKTIDDQLYLPPLNQGWSRLVVFRQKNKIQCDVYYVNPAGKKFRSMKELERGILDDKRVKGLSIENFTFVRRALNLDHPKQVIQKSGARQRGQMMESSPVHALRPLTTLVQKRRPPVRRGVRTNSDPKLSFLSQLDLDSTELQPRVVLEDIMLTKSSERRASLTASEEPVNGCCDTQSADGDEISSQSESNSLRNEDNEAATSEEETTQQMITDEDNEGATSELGQNQHQEDVTSNLETHNVDELPDIHGDTPGWADEKTPDADEEIPDESTTDEKPPDENNTNEEIPDENTAAEKTRDESNIGEKIPDENPDEEMPDERKTDEQIPVGNNTEGNILDGNNTEGKILDGNNTEEEIPESKDPVECEPCETLELPDDPAENLDKSEETPSEFKSPDEDNKTYKEGNSADDALVHPEVQADFTGDSEGLCMELSSIPDFPSHAEDKGSISIEDLVDADDVLWVSQPDPERT